MLPAGLAHADDEVPEPAEFTSMLTTMATPDMVVNSDDQPSPGEPGASGTFTFRINSDDEIICYDIVLNGVTPPYDSPARTATHIHEAAAGTSGPPRLVFPDPEDAGDGTLRSEGCMQGPFTTGLTGDDDVTDTGEGFSLAQLEAAPEQFFADTHTSQFTDGAVRGQLSMVPMGGAETGGGATAQDEPGALLPLGALAATALGAGLIVVARNRTTQSDR
ncbi:CHRD domain-containing protein [Allosaccharopolyspora coralli]|uniref:CHRD domain-containing protein n=1 Tax=Allosaccharopolyspora coralli TaxID=2665642 RepID=A0A5Q3QBZ5_9PSEU|nr:CHRD domain-containing protein [Allosaccharopolyspora coralli]